MTSLTHHHQFLTNLHHHFECNLHLHLNLAQVLDLLWSIASEALVTILLLLTAPPLPANVGSPEVEDLLPNLQSPSLDDVEGV